LGGYTRNTWGSEGLLFTRTYKGLRGEVGKNEIKALEVDH